MRTWFGHLDRILRGEATAPATISKGRLDIPLFGTLFVVTLLALAAGACVGSYAVLRPESAPDAWQQLLASTVKMPMLFLLTLLVTFPSLYVFNALIGSRLAFGSALKLLAAMLAVILAVHASFGPIVVFFSVSTDSYSFMVVLNVIFAGVGGLLGLGFLWRTLKRLAVVEAYLQPQPRALERRDDDAQPVAQEPAAESSEPADDNTETDSSEPYELRAQETEKPLPPELTDSRRGMRAVFLVWMILFSLVGAQMSWILRPFIGSPGKEFQWIRERGDMNFFTSVYNSTSDLLGYGTQFPRNEPDEPTRRRDD